MSAAQTAAFLRRRKAGVADDLARRTEFVRARLPEAAALLRSQFGATRVWLFGSHVIGTLHAESDVDIAVEGVPPESIDRAHAEVESVLGSVVDLVPLESAPESLRRRVEAEGRQL